MGDTEQSPEEALKRELEMTRGFLTQREQELVERGNQLRELQQQLEGAASRIRDAETKAATYAQFQSTLDQKLQHEPGLLKRTRAEELLLVKPYIQPGSAIDDFHNGLAILQTMGANEREFDWTRHYFFEPLKVLDKKRQLRKIPGRSYLLFGKIAQEFAKGQQGLALVQVEALLYRLMRVPSDYRKALTLLRERNLALSQIWPELHTDEAYAMYGDSLLRRLTQFNDLTSDERAVLHLRTRSSFDNREEFRKALAAGSIPHAERLRPLYERIASQEIEDAHHPYPVNLRWYERLPKDLGAFLQDYRRKPRLTP